MTSSSLRKTTRNRRVQPTQEPKLIDFNFEGVAYVLDLNRNKVYRNWMAVETNKGFLILGAYRHTAAITA